MMDAWLFAWSNLVKLFFFFCPFYVLNFFLSVTEGAPSSQKRDLAVRVTLTVLICTFILYFAGATLLTLFGLELEGFRIGSGILLLVLALELALGNDTPTSKTKPRHLKDIVVVPMAIPTILGPGGVSAIIILGAESLHSTKIDWNTLLFGLLGFIGAILLMGAILFFAERIERFCGKNVIRILSKISGIILMAIAAQMITKGFFTYLDNSVVGQKILEALAK